jgi:hypothetical protein
MQPNFETMTFQELRAYVLEHHEDMEALRFLFLKKGTPDTKAYGIPQTAEEWQEQEDAIRRRINGDKA